MAQDPILVEATKPVAYLTLNRPEQRNPLDWSSVRQLKGAIEQLEEDAALRFVVIRGAGGHFSAGGDLKGYLELYRKPAEFRQFLEDFHGLLDRMERSDKVYIAIVEGYCVAGGLELLLACDLAIAAQSAKIGDGHVNFGQLPGAGGSQRLPRTIGPMHARYLMLTGELLDGAEAARIGLVSRVVPDAELGVFTDKLVGRLRGASALGLKGMKHLANRGLSMALADALRMELEYVHDYATTSRDAGEGLVAFAEKRKPSFSGS
jgi:enoyl-CoA hydratase